MHVGIGAGEVHKLIVGGVLDRWEVCCGGAPMKQLATAVSDAKGGEVCLSGQAFTYISELTTEAELVSCERPTLHDRPRLGLPRPPSPPPSPTLAQLSPSSLHPAPTQRLSTHIPARTTHLIPQVRLENGNVKVLKFMECGRRYGSTILAQHSISRKDAGKSCIFSSRGTVPS